MRRHVTAGALPRRAWGLLALTPALLASHLAFAQATVKPDEQWRMLLTLGGSYASGNSQSSSFNIDAEAVQASMVDKWLLKGRALYTTDRDDTRAERLALGVRHDHELGDQHFSFIEANGARDRAANLLGRLSTSAGLGWHIEDNDALKWSMLLGGGYTYDRYVAPKWVADAQRRNYGRVEALLGEESTHTFGAKATFHQEFTLYPDLQRLKSSRAAFESSVSAPLTAVFSLTAKVVYAYNNDPGPDLSRFDLLFVTGVTMRLD